MLIEKCAWGVEIYYFCLVYVSRIQKGEARVQEQNVFPQQIKTFDMDGEPSIEYILKFPTFQIVSVLWYYSCQGENVP